MSNNFIDREAVNENSMDGLEISDSDHPKVVNKRSKKKQCKIS